MAVFLINICKFNGCGITFPSLSKLIQHIEDTHIDYDPKVVEQKEQAQPACLPLSYVLRFISEDARSKDSQFISNNVTTTGVDLKRKLAIKHHSYSMSSSNRSNTPTGSEMDEDEMVVSESEDSNDSWTTEEFSSEFIMRYGSRHSGTGGNGTPGNEKPFACPVPGCKKRYKNVNGIKYHSKNGHKKDGKVRKGYKCHCGKSYKTAQGLKSHALVAHNSTGADGILSTTQSSNNLLPQRSSSPSQSLGSLSPSSISNMSSSASSYHGGSNNINTFCSQTSNNSGGIQLQLAPQSSAQFVNSVATPITVGGGGATAISVIGNNSGGGGSTTTVAATTDSSSGAVLGGGLLVQSTSTVLTAAAATPSSAAAKPSRSSMPTQPLIGCAAPTHSNAMPSAFYPTASAISPTFIEHKYSANVIKQRFMANLRTNTNSSKASNSGENCASTANSAGVGAAVPASVAETKQFNAAAQMDAKPHQNSSGNSNADAIKDANDSQRSVNGVVGAAANVCSDGAAGAGITELCSMQNLNEVYNNLCQKTIN